MTNKWFDRIILILISALLIFGLLLIGRLQEKAGSKQSAYDWGEKANFAGIEVIEQSQYDLIKAMYEPLLQVPDLAYGDSEAAYDKETNTFYVSTFDNPNTVEGLLSVNDSQINTFILENEYRNYQDIIAREAAKFNVLFVKYDKYAEATICFTNNRVEALDSDSQSISINDNSNTVTLKKGKDKTKYYQIDINDKTFSREIISLNLWNSIVPESMKKDFEVCELFIDDTALGLYIKTEKDWLSTDLASNIDKVDKNSLADYLLLTQIVFAYKNAEEHYCLIQQDADYAVVPQRIKYSFGTYSKNKKYLEYNVYERKLSLADFGIENASLDNEIDELVKNRYVALRDNILSDDELLAKMSEVFSWTDNSGCVARYGTFDEFRQSRDEAFEFMENRLKGLDKIYGLSEPDEQKDIDFTKIYLKLGTDILARNSLYQDEEGFVFYIPSFYKENEAIIVFDDDIYDLTFDGKELKSQDSIIIDDLKHEAIVKDKNTDLSITKELVFLKSANLPTIFIDTANKTTDYIGIKSKDKVDMNSEPGSYLCYDENGQADSIYELKKIRCRGNSSFIEGDKLSYQISFEEPTSVLGMDEACKWVLQANTIDNTRMRNYIVYYYASELGMKVCMDNKYADVYINGEYQGNYLVCEKPEIAPNRIELDQDGFFVSVINQTRLRTIDYGIEADGIYYRLYYDKESPDKVKRQRVASIISDISNLIDEGNDDTYDELSSKLDLDSFADMYLLNMLANERDANKFSTYYYYKDACLNAGPVWDYDRAFKNNGDNMEEKYYKNDYPDGLPENCFAFEAYQNMVSQKWNNQLKPIVERSKLENEIVYSKINEIKPSIVLDYRKNLGIASTELAMREYESAISYMFDAIDERVSLIDEILSNKDKFTKEYDDENLVTYWIKH